MKSNPLKICFLIILSVLLTSCSGAAEETIQPTQPLPPTPTLSDEPIYFGEVTFNKDNECTVDGPEEVTRGKYYFTLVNESDDDLMVFLNYLSDDKTIDDLVDWQEEPGVYLSPPPWVDHPFALYNFEVETEVHHLDQVGYYAVVVGDNLMRILWFCEPFNVVEPSTK
jgi:hypothetical protein